MTHRLLVLATCVVLTAALHEQAPGRLSSTDEDETLRRFQALLNDTSNPPGNLQ
jgi:hypothetical protein